MNRVLTADGSHTVHVPEINEHYHSIFGAVAESRHVFIEAGLKTLTNRGQINLLEVGFGTGLNALLTFLESAGAGTFIRYDALEKYPLDPVFAMQLNYTEILGNTPLMCELFTILHYSEWDRDIEINDKFRFRKIKAGLAEFEPSGTYDLVYFDAFAPDKQPEMWTQEVFIRLFNAMNEDGIMVTYCVKGDVRRAMKNAGFTIEKLPGAAGKREMLRGRKKKNPCKPDLQGYM